MVIATTWRMVLVTLLMASANAVAQKSPLVITGSVTQVKVGGRFVTTPINKDNAWEGFRRERKTSQFHVSIHLQYCNQGEVTLIVPTHYSFPNERKKMIFLELPASDSKVLAVVTGIDFSGTRDPMPAFLNELEKLEPSRYLFAIIEPGRCHESGDMIFVESGYKLEVRPSGDKRKLDFEVAIPEHSYFKLQYSVSMKDTLPVADAKRRWSNLGKLLTTADGDFFLETEFVINKLPD